MNDLIIKRNLVQKMETYDTLRLSEFSNISKGVLAIKHFKNKRYWILMPPFLIITLLLFFSLPENYKFNSFLVLIAFWITYHTWDYYSNKKQSYQNEK